jgi:hypothetical protein
MLWSFCIHCSIILAIKMLWSFVVFAFCICAVAVVLSFFGGGGGTW